MKVVKNSHLYLTENEKNILSEASLLLDKIATAMDRATSVEWCIFDDDEIWGAQEIIDDLLLHAESENEAKK